MKCHLCLIHLSKESSTEGELSFARAGLFDVEDSVMAKCGSAQSIDALLAPKFSLPVSDTPWQGF